MVTISKYHASMWEDTPLKLVSHSLSKTTNQKRFQNQFTLLSSSVWLHVIVLSVIMTSGSFLRLYVEGVNGGW
jgi:hypothetical protein